MTVCPARPTSDPGRAGVFLPFTCDEITGSGGPSDDRKAPATRRKRHGLSHEHSGRSPRAGHFPERWSFSERVSSERGFDWCDNLIRLDTPPEALTPRQRDILILIAEGLSAKEIAGRLNLSTRTVEFHKSALCERLGFRTTAELVRYVIRTGLMEA